MTLAFYGPDGAGKSVLIDCVVRLLQPRFDRVVYHHFRPHFYRRQAHGPPNVEPHARPLRPVFLRTAKTFLYFADAWISYLTRGAWLEARGALIVFDRYVDDVLADPQRYRMRISRFDKTMLSLVPPPTLRIFVFADEELILARKRELSPAALRATLAEYERLCRRTGGVRVTNNGDPETAAAAIAEIVLERL